MSKNSPANSTQQSFGTKNSVGRGSNSKEKGPSMANSMQRTFNRRSPVKQPRGSQDANAPRDSGARSSGGSKSPFRGQKQSIVSASPAIGDTGNISQREKYVTGDGDYLSTQERGPVVGDHSSIYMNTEEAATRMAEAGNEHNIKESLRIGVS